MDGALKKRAGSFTRNARRQLLNLAEAMGDAPVIHHSIAFDEGAYVRYLAEGEARMQELERLIRESGGWGVDN